MLPGDQAVPMSCFLSQHIVFFSPVPRVEVGLLLWPSTHEIAESLAGFRCEGVCQSSLSNPKLPSLPHR